MSEGIGFVTVVPAEARGPLITGAGETSEATQQVDDEQVRQLIDTAHREVEALAHAPLKDETT